MAQSDPTALITDPFLLSILQTSSTARSSAITLLNTPASTAASNPPSLQKPLTNNLSRLRHLNRTLAHTLRQTKAHTSASRSEVDTLHLSLQNLYYESRHLAGEIQGCEGYAHAYAALPMVGEEEFLGVFVEWRERVVRARSGVGEMEGVVEEGIMEGEGQGDELGREENGEKEGKESEEKEGEEKEGEENEEEEDIESALMRARIDHEYQVRVDLEEERKRLVARKMELVKENATRKEELGQLDVEMEAFIKAAEPIQSRFDKEWS